MFVRIFAGVLPVFPAVDELTGGLRVTASFDFRTTQCNGLLLYIASTSQPDHLALELVDGVVGLVVGVQ